jgi:hypothetical protein
MYVFGRCVKRGATSPGGVANAKRPVVPSASSTASSFLVRHLSAAGAKPRSRLTWLPGRLRYHRHHGGRRRGRSGRSARWRRAPWHAGRRACRRSASGHRRACRGPRARRWVRSAPRRTLRHPRGRDGGRAARRALWRRAAGRGALEGWRRRPARPNRRGRAGPHGRRPSRRSAARERGRCAWPQGRRHAARGLRRLRRLHAGPPLGGRARAHATEWVSQSEGPSYRTPEKHQGAANRPRGTFAQARAHCSSGSMHAADPNLAFVLVCEAGGLQRCKRESEISRRKTLTGELTETSGAMPNIPVRGPSCLSRATDARARSKCCTACQRSLWYRSAEPLGPRALDDRRRAGLSVPRASEGAAWRARASHRRRRDFPL